MASAATAVRTATRKSAGKTSAAEIEKQINRIRTDISGLTEAVASYGTAKAGEYQATATGKAEELSIQTREALEAAKAELARIEKQVALQVRDKPLQALGFAVAAGFLAALVFRR